MAKLDQKKKNIILIVVMIVIVIIVIFVLFKNKSSEPSVTTIDDVFTTEGQIPIVPKVINEDVFQSEDFKRLQDYTKGSLELEPRGRVNPFEPFVVSIE